MASATDEVLERIRHATGTRWELRGRLDGGLQGGVRELRSDTGARAVLKVTEDAEWGERVIAAAPVVARARADGYPTPRWLAHGALDGGGAWVVQSWLGGRALDIRASDTPELLDALLGTQAGLDPDPSRNWSDYVPGVVFGDAADGLRASGAEGRDVVDAFRRTLRGRAHVVLPRDDLVHGDLSPGNVHVADGRVTGVIDLEALGSGTRVIDWATAIRSAWTADAPRAVIDGLTRRARAVAGDDVLALCAAASSFEFLEFLLRRDDPALRHAADRLRAFASDLV